MVCLHDTFHFLIVLCAVNVFAFFTIQLPQLPIVSTFVAACNFAAVAIMTLLSVAPDWVPTQTVALASLMTAMVVFFYAILNSASSVMITLLFSVLFGPILIQSRSHAQQFIMQQGWNISDLTLVILAVVFAIILLFVYGLGRRNIYLQLTGTNAVFSFLLVFSLRAFVIQHFVLDENEQLCCGKEYASSQCPFVFKWWMILLLCLAFVYRSVVSFRYFQEQERLYINKMFRKQNPKLHHYTTISSSASDGVDRESAAGLAVHDQSSEEQMEQQEQLLRLPLRSVPEHMRLSISHNSSTD